MVWFQVNAVRYDIQASPWNPQILAPQTGPQGPQAPYPSCPRPNPPASLDPLVKTAALVRALRWKKNMFWAVKWHGIHGFPWISLLHLSTKADIQLKPLNDTVKAVWDGTQSLWIHWWMKSGWIFWEFEFVWASAIGEFLSFRQPDFTMATVATLVFRELYIYIYVFLF